MLSKIKKFLKRYYPISNRWFYCETSSLKDSAMELKKRSGGIRSAVDRIGGSVAELCKKLDEVLKRIKSLNSSAPSDDRIGYIVSLLEKNAKARAIDALELYFIEVNFKREFSFGAWPTRLHCCVRVKCGEHSGWGEIRLANADIPNDEVVKKVVKDMDPWRGASLDLARYLVVSRRGKTPDRILEALDMALLDVAARIEGKSVLEYLALPSDYAVPSLHCILQKDIEKAKSLAAQFAKTHLKVKLFGDNVHDYNLIKAIRSVIPADCFLVGDVNMGYGNAKSGVEYSSDIVKALRNLKDAGLDACEDPANLSWSDLARLQQELPALAIIPDEPMRPSYKVLKTVTPVAGHIYNLHPNCMGSVTAVVELAKKIKSAGAQVMLGDDSLIGPACNAWQQIAIGIKAAWCESLEKPEESSEFIDCIKSSPIEVLADGRHKLKMSVPGFGVDVEVEKLRRNCVAFVEL